MSLLAGCLEFGLLRAHDIRPIEAFFVCLTAQRSVASRASQPLRIRTNVARGLPTATFWAAVGRDPPIEFRGLFAGQNATRRSAAKILDGSRSGSRTNRPPIRSRSGLPPTGGPVCP